MDSKKGSENEQATQETPTTEQAQAPAPTLEKHTEPSPFAGKTLKFKTKWNTLGGVEFHVEDWYDRVLGVESWEDSDNSECQRYQEKVNSIDIPKDNNVLIGKIGSGFTVMVNLDELDLEGKEEQPVTEVFYYNGYIGFSTTYGAKGLMMSPLSRDGHMGMVVELSEVKFSKEAADVLKELKPGNDTGELTIFKGKGKEEDGFDPEKTYFGWYGDNRTVLNIKRITMDEEYDPSSIMATEGIEVPQDFKDFIDNDKEMAE